MNRNDLITIAQRLREYVGNPHHVDPMSDAFKMLIGEASEALSQAAQPQGEPVGFRYRANNEPWVWMDESPFADGRHHYKQGYEELEPLYAEQPAPVAVVMPGRNTASKNLGIEQCGYVDGWNSCLDEVTRLNTK